MQDGSEYANPRFVDSWNELDWQIWESENKKVLEAMKKRRIKRIKMEDDGY